jgi:hypothetical protein
MADSLLSGDLVGAVADALRGDRTMLRGMLADARQRASERLRDAAGSGAQAPGGAAPGPAPLARPMPPLSPDRGVEIQLPNGRRVRALLSPAVARRTDLSAVRRISAANDRRAFAAIRRLSRSQKDLADKMTALEGQADRAIIGLIQGFAGLERRVRTTAAQTRAVVAAMPALAPAAGQVRDTRQLRHARTGGPIRRIDRARRAQQLQRVQQMREVRALATRAQIQSVTNVVNSVQTAAYGQKGSVFAANNLLLAGNQLLWTVMDPVLQRMGVLNAASATVVAAVAPLGALLTGEVLLSDRQHERFISGVSTFGESEVLLESLRGKVAEALWPEFQRRTNVPVTANVVGESFDGTVAADVVRGVLSLRLVPNDIERSVAGIRVAWMVDTGADIG